jgi:predicted ATPase
VTGSFRLLQAFGGFRRRDLFGSASDDANPNDVEFSLDPSAVQPGPWVSVVIGKNGVGKSRLLAGIAEVFDAMYRGRDKIRTEGLSISKVAYLCDGARCEIFTDMDFGLRAMVNGQPCSPFNLPLPSKVIALTTTPFDKFRISRSLLTLPMKEEAISPDQDRYIYLGLRDRTGRASPTAPIYRALEGLFEASTAGEIRRLKIADVFEFLGYQPQVEVRYEFSMSGMKRLNAIVAGQPIDVLLETTQKRITPHPLERLLSRNPSLVHQLRQVGREALERSQGGRSIVLRADFAAHSADDQFFRKVQLLRRADLVRMRSVEVQRIADQSKFDLRLASSGELGIVTGFLGIASAIEDGSLIFIDEPEISLHPEWQTRYIDLLVRTFGEFDGCHFVLATHSPLILSDIAPKNSNVVLLDANRKEKDDAEQFAGQSSDHLLVTAFQVPGKNNLYLKQELIKALRLAASGKAKTIEFRSVLDPLLDLLPELEEGSAVGKLIAELNAASQVDADQ